MPRPPTTWKAFELRIAKRIGGKRRGAYTSEGGKKGKSDIIKPGWSIECKFMASPGWMDMYKACLQAEKARENDLEIPIAIVKKKGKPDKDSLVVMRLEEFQKFFD